MSDNIYEELRYNLTTKNMQYFEAGTWYPSQWVLPQVSQYVFTGGNLITANSFTGLDLLKTMALQKATNSVKITITAAGINHDGNASSAVYSIFADSTNLGHSSWGLTQISATGGGNMISPVSMTFVYSPGDTLSHTYRLFCRNTDSTTQVGIGLNSVIVLEEILS